jgi:hypothetical protein
MERIISAINQSAQQWKVSKKLAWWIIALPLIGAVLVAASRASRPLFTFITMEDGPLEYPQFLCYLAAAIFAAGVAYKRLRAGHPWQALMFLAFGVGSFVIAGEEISWGQRIFGWQTPEELAAINHQGETTVHNIRWVQELLGALLTVASGVAIALPFASKKYKFGERWDQANFLMAPPFFLATCFFAMFAYKIVRFVAFPDSEFTVTKYGEWPELCFAAGLALFAYLNYRRLSVSPAPAVGAGAGQVRVAK